MYAQAPFSVLAFTGDLAAAIQACKTTDECLGDLLATADEVNARFLVTADHGNADDMVQRDKKGKPLVSAVLRLLNCRHEMCSYINNK